MRAPGSAPRRRPAFVLGALVPALLAIAAGAAPAKPPPDDAGQEPARPRPFAVGFDERANDRLVLTAPAYQLTLSKRNGTILDLVDRAGGGSVVRESLGCMWGAVAVQTTSYVGGCSFAPSTERRFTYAWDRAAATLTLRYGEPGAAGVGAVVTLRARASSFDLRATIENRGAAVLRSVHLPVTLVDATAAVEAGYAPNYLPGVRLGPKFFSRVGNNVLWYPSRWAFADYVALDLRGGRLAVHAVAPDRPYPAEIGFVHNPVPAQCSGDEFCIVHAFQTWIRPGASWTSATVRITVGEPVEETIAAYRRDNGIDRYPSLAEKLGARLPTLAKAPLIKADLPKLSPFAAWGPDLRRLPSPALVHPVSFQPGGFDAGDPDFLPPDPRWGTTADFRAVVADAHALGLLVMPYLNVSWWDGDAPTLRALGARGPAEVGVHDEDGKPVLEGFGGRTGIITSAHAPLVRDRVRRLFEEWRTDVPADCLFFDQLGARTWLRDFHPASPDPLSYYDGWLDLIEPYRDRCLMVEEGWDRLARDTSGFHGSSLMMQREHEEPDRKFGAGNWAPFPLATWLLHDKVLLYQHDLYEGTMVTDPEVLTWNMAFGLVSSYSWDGWVGSLASPWLDLVGDFQRAVGPAYAGKPLSAYRELAGGQTESTFGDLVVTASWDREHTARVGEYGVAPQGFLARTRDGALVAGAFAGAFAGTLLSPGTHYLIVERGEGGTTVRQPLGGDTELAVEAPAMRQTGGTLRATALGRAGEPLGEVAGDLRGGRFVFRYAGSLGGRPVAAYRIAPA